MKGGREWIGKCRVVRVCAYMCVSEGGAPQGAACHSSVMLIDMSIVTEREVSSYRRGEHKR